MNSKTWASVALLLAAVAHAEPPGSVLVPAGSVWRYLDDGSDAGTAWRVPGFDDSGWSSGPAQLGFGEGDESTVLDGGSGGDRHVTFWLRHTFPVADPASITGLTLSLLRDDGAIVYLNGSEIARSNLPPGAVDFQTLAASDVDGEDEQAFLVSCAAAQLVPGNNVLAVEVHQSRPNSNDLSFDLSLAVVGASPSLVRPPYLQIGTPESVVVRWRTDACADSTVRWGDAPGSLTQVIPAQSVTTEHEVEISGLVPDTRYYYAVGTSDRVLAGGDADHFFSTPPLPASRLPLRIWVVGDSGECGSSVQGCIDAGAVRDAYLGFAAGEPAQVWLMLGDNAYSEGRDLEYTVGLFEVYPQVLRNTVLWPVPGNHDYDSADPVTLTGPYYEAFTLPTQGEAGGLPSGTEAYYAFDHDNVHFVALDSHDTDRSAPADPVADVCAPGQGGAMYQWLCADLAATSQDFVIAYWHHPPYSKGSHNSDSGGRMSEMRERFLPVLEAYGVDLQLTGHSHSYERSILLDGHYGNSSSYDPALHAVDPGDGDPEGDGAYAKSGPGPVAHGGAVYSVVGSSSKVSSGPLNHPVMTVSLEMLGSLVIDVQGPQLDATFVDGGGTVRDRFRIVKPVPEPGRIVLLASGLAALGLLRRQRERGR